MGGTEKLLLRLGEASILETILRRVRHQVDRLAINVRPASRTQYEGCIEQHVAIISDPFRGTCGPLGGVVAGLRWLAGLGEDYQWLASFPGDAPFLPPDLVPLLSSVVSQGTSRPVVATDRERIQSLCALWPAACLHALSRGVRDGRLRSVRNALDEFGAIQYPVCTEHAFMNINTPRDLADAERLVMKQQALSAAN